MKKILSSNIFLIAFLVITISYLITLISNEVVLNDKVYKKYLDEKYETKYDEYKDLDIDLSEFEDELARFEQNPQDSSYDWELFYVDAMLVIVPFILVVIGFSITFLILILFHKRLHVVKYLDLLKASLISYLVFYIPDILSAINFLIYKKSYEFNDIGIFENYFKFSVFFNKENIQKWLWDIVNETGIVYLFFPLIVGFFLSLMYNNFKKSTLIGYSYLAYLIVFIFYNTVFWYLFDLV